MIWINFIVSVQLINHSFISESFLKLTGPVTFLDRIILFNVVELVVLPESRTQPMLHQDGSFWLVHHLLHHFLSEERNFHNLLLVNNFFLNHRFFNFFYSLNNDGHLFLFYLFNKNRLNLSVGLFFQFPQLRNDFFRRFGFQGFHNFAQKWLEPTCLLDRFFLVDRENGFCRKELVPFFFLPGGEVLEIGYIDKILSEVGDFLL